MKNINHIIKTTYETLHPTYPQLTIGQVEKYITFMFEEFKEHANSLKSSGIRIKNVGVFNMHPSKVKRYIENTTADLEVLKNIQEKENKVFEQYQRRLEEFNKAMPIFTKIIEHNDKFRQQRKDRLDIKFNRKKQ